MSQPQIIAGRYELLDEIGQGGMGKVYKGRDIKTGELVAVKALRPDVVESDPSMVERFDREGEALRRLNHPNMVSILANIEENDAHYLIMDYVAGGTLNDLMRKENPLPITKVLNIALDLSDALTRAHRLKILHRDIKPANVLIADDGTPRLTDFGVARMEDRSRVTEAGMIIGTYNYLSPEAIHGIEPDERADIWAFGVMLFEMLTNKRPFEKNQVGAIIGSILNDPTPDLIDLRPDTPPQLVELIYKMLEKDRDERISSARQIGVAIEDIIRAIDSSAIPISSSLKQQVEEGTRFEMTPTAEKVTGTVAHAEPSGNTPSAFGGTPIPIPPKGGSYTYTDASGNQFVITATQQQRRNRILMIGLPAVAAIALFIVMIAVINGQNASDDADETPQSTLVAAGDDATAAAPPDSPPPTLALPPPPSALDGSGGQGVDPGTLPSVPPVNDDEIMVMIAVPEFVGNENSPRQNNIVHAINGDLRPRLEAVSFSPIVMRPSGALITNSEQARTFAMRNNATIIIWGSYDEGAIDLHIDFGTLDKFPHIAFDTDFLETIASVQVSVSDLRTQTIAPYVLSTLGILYGADGDAYNYMKMAGLFQNLVDQSRAQLVTGSVNAHMHRAFLLHLEDTEAAIDELEAALALDGTNPMIFAMLSLANARLGDVEAAVRDANTAANLGPDAWAIPLYTRSVTALLSEITPQQSISLLDQIIEMRPDDWYAYSLRAGLYHAAGAYPLAREDAEKAIELGPDVSLPFVYATMIAVRQGEIETARGYINRVLDVYSDPTLLNRILSATFGERADPQVIASSSFGWLIIGQPERALSDIERLEAGVILQSADLSFFEGMAACAIEDFPRAETAFQNAIAADSNFTLAHLMYTSTLRSQNKTRQIALYLDTLREALTNSPMNMREILGAVQNGDITCGNLFAG